MEKRPFILHLRDEDTDFLLLANIDPENTELVRQQISEQLVVRHTYNYCVAGQTYPAIDPKILEQLKSITGYDFIGLEPDLYLHFKRENLTGLIPGRI